MTRRHGTAADPRDRRPRAELRPNPGTRPVGPPRPSTSIRLNLPTTPLPVPPPPPPPPRPTGRADAPATPARPTSSVTSPGSPPPTSPSQPRDTPSRDEGTAQRRSPSRARWLVAVPVGLLLLAILVDDRDPVDPTHRTAVEHAATDERGGYTLPPPYGNKPRTRPLQTAWILAADLTDDPDVGAVVTEEGADAVAYLRNHALTGDGLSLTGESSRRLAASDPEPLKKSIEAPQTWDVAAATAASEVAHRLELAFPDDHHSLVAITTDADWAAGYAPRVDPLNTSQDRRIHRFLIVLEPGLGTSPVLHGDEPLPAEFRIDPDEPGEFATALARTWVQSYGGGWGQQR